ncbi:hypothetical protein [uncultured Jatrophihabitans sp.]|uniref:hypothetical protein n=1 Tax=uncultured Jatrophihabitans sp. TaxID=1610747 RepID=UPI0035CC5F7F
MTGVMAVASTAAPAADARLARLPARRAASGLRLPRLIGLTPLLVAVLNAAAFVLVRPDVNDLWAARARASAVNHGVGLTYWFSWFGGGATPGNYSVVSPYLCAWIGTELVGALSAVAVTALVMLLVRDLRHPAAAGAVVCVAAAANLWSGRVPFLLGSALAVGALLALRARRRTPTIALTLLSILASPVAGAFLLLGVSGTFLTTRTKSWRPIVGYAAGTAAFALIAVALAFGAPGPEPYSVTLAVQILAGLALMWVARPPDHLRTTLLVSALAGVALWLVPNGMGSNFARFVWFCLPVAVVATSRRRAWVLLLTVAPLVGYGSWQTVVDLRNAARPVSSVDYYKPLATRLAAIPNLQNYRVEVVNHGAHAGYDALLPYASLARGWETQADLSLNKALNLDPLPPTTYKVWLDNNAVGYVALPSAMVGGSPEYRLVQAGAPYLHKIWQDADWQLFTVRHPTAIVGAPARLVAHSQSTMTISIPCACRVAVRVRWSKFLDAATQPAPERRTSTAQPSQATLPPPEPIVAKVSDDGFGWTQLTTTQPGVYTMSGSISGIVR